MNPQMTDAHSEAILATVHLVLADKVRGAAVELAASNIYFRVAQGYRTYAQQHALYMQSRGGTPSGPPVTNADEGYGNHNFGFAVDCFPFVLGNCGALDLTNPDTAEFKAMVAAMKDQGLAWGGDWHHADAPHFQLAQVPVTPTQADRDAYARGGLQAVWAQYNLT